MLTLHLILEDKLNGKGRVGEGRETKLTPIHWPKVLEWVLVSSMVIINHVLMELSTVINHSIVPDCCIPLVETNFNIMVAGS